MVTQFKPMSKYSFKILYTLISRKHIKGLSVIMFIDRQKHGHNYRNRHNYRQANRKAVQSTLTLLTYHYYICCICDSSSQQHTGVLFKVHVKVTSKMIHSVPKKKTIDHSSEAMAVFTGSLRESFKVQVYPYIHCSQRSKASEINVNQM